MKDGDSRAGSKCVFPCYGTLEELCEGGYKVGCPANNELCSLFPRNKASELHDVLSNRQKFVCLSSPKDEVKSLVGCFFFATKTSITSPLKVMAY